MTSDKTYIVRKAAGREEINCEIAAAEIDGRVACGRAEAWETTLGGGGATAGRGTGGGAAIGCFFGPMPRRIIC